MEGFSVGARYTSRARSVDLDAVKALFQRVPNNVEQTPKHPGYEILFSDSEKAIEVGVYSNGNVSYREAMEREHFTAGTLLSLVERGQLIILGLDPLGDNYNNQVILSLKDTKRGVGAFYMANQGVVSEFAEELFPYPVVGEPTIIDDTVLVTVSNEDRLPIRDLAE